METYNSDKFKRDPEAIKKALVTKNKVINTTTDVRVLFPERYINQDLAMLGSTVRVVGIYAILDDNNNYGLVMVPAYMELAPNNIIDVMVDGVVNKCLYFDKGSVFCTNTDLIKNADFMYNLFDEFFIKGKIPWYLNYNDISDVLLEARKYAGSSIGDNPIAYEILAGIISRSSDDKTVYLRHVINSNKPSKDKKFIGLNNIYYSFDNTASKVVGGYYSVGVPTAIVSKEKTRTKVADMLRA